jgi:hypothetical protein
MASRTEIANLALSHLGVDKLIGNIETENSKEANTSRTYFDKGLEFVNTDFVHPFLVKYEALALVEENPNDDWLYSYRFPSDCLRAVKIVSGSRNDSRQSKVVYEVAYGSSGTLIYTDRVNAVLKYVKRIDSVNVLPPDIVMAFSFYLAFLMAPRLTAGDPFNLREAMFQAYSYHKSIYESRSLNQQQADEPVDSEFIRDRE